MIFDFGNVLIRWDPFPAVAVPLGEDEARRFFDGFDFHSWNLAQDAGRSWGDGLAELERQAPELARHGRAYLENFPESLRGGLIEENVQLLRDLRAQLGVSVLFITHDVATARYVGHGGELYVLYRGTVVERGPVDALIASPVHPYTQSLLSAVPVLRGIERPALDRVVPTGPLDEHADVPGCLFEPRCPFAAPGCRAQQPPLVPLGAASGQPQAHACLFPNRRLVVPVPAATGASPEAPERSGASCPPHAEPGPGPTQVQSLD